MSEKNVFKTGTIIRTLALHCWKHMLTQNFFKNVVTRYFYFIVTFLGHKQYTVSGLEGWNKQNENL